MKIKILIKILRFNLMTLLGKKIVTMPFNSAFLIPHFSIFINVVVRQFLIIFRYFHSLFNLVLQYHHNIFFISVLFELRNKIIAFIKKYYN